MQQINLLLDNYSLYCPVTGQNILGEIEDIQTSPAMVYCYIDEGEDFEHAAKWVKELYKKCMTESKDDAMDAYDLMVSEINKMDTQNLVCLNITDDSFGSPILGKFRFCFDMNYTPKN